MQSNTGTIERINSYALVTYIPGPLGQFLDELRQQLVPSCVAQSHVTVLPPRALPAGDLEARKELERELAEFAPFKIDLALVDHFETTNVIFLAVGLGAVELKHMHDGLNRGGLVFHEPYIYHPHVTLAQDFPPQELADMKRFAQDRWERFEHARWFQVEYLTFVQNTNENRWQDLAEFPLGDSVLARA